MKKSHLSKQDIMGYDRNCLCCPTYCCDFADICIQMSVEVILFSNFQSILVTGRNEVVVKVMFLHVSVILSTGGVSRQREHTPQTRQGDPPGRETPPGPGRPPGRETPPQTRQTPPGSRLQHMVNEWLVHILLECILVMGYSFPS